MPRMPLSLLPALCMAALTGLAAPLAAQTFSTEKHPIVAETVVEGLQRPWALAFLPGGDLLITERPGRLRRVSDGQLLDQAIAGLPEIREKGQGGLLGIALHPDFAANRTLFLAYAGRDGRSFGTEVIRARLSGMQLEDVRVIFRALPKSRGGRHFGGRLVFDAAGRLYLSLGDRGEGPSAQDLGDHRGSLIRIMADGSVPRDNPFVDSAGARPEIFTYGNRNMQGMTLHPESGLVWTHEHGPQGGDEINVMTGGVNYGWPVITYGVNYGIGTKIGEGTAKPGMRQPVHKWVPSIAPSGMTFYTGAPFANWRGDLLVGSLKFGQLVRLELDASGRQVVHEERMLDAAFGRIRDVVQGPDGLLYLLTDNGRDKLIRLRPGGA